MSVKASRLIFIIEYIIIVVPLSLLLLVATIMKTTITIGFFNWYNITNTLFALIACAAVLSGIGIGGTFIKQGYSEIHNSKPILWVFVFLGATLSLAAGISIILPPSPEYSVQEMFRNDFELFILGFPMIIPLAHLILERFLRKEKSQV